MTFLIRMYGIYYERYEEIIQMIYRQAPTKFTFNKQIFFRFSLSSFTQFNNKRLTFLNK